MNWFISLLKAFWCEHQRKKKFRNDPEIRKLIKEQNRKLKL